MEGKFEQTFPQRKQMVNKHVKKCSPSLVMIEKGISIVKIQGDTDPIMVATICQAFICVSSIMT